MAETYTYYQPEYVSKFQCDGEICTENCCKKNWLIIIDSNTYQKYLGIKPKNVAQEITRHISKRGGADNDYQLVFGEKNCCPFLTEDNWCSIQKKYGAEYLSQVCATYPRRISNFYKFYECALSLSCPLAAELILLEKEPLKFEIIEVPEKIHSGYQIETPNFEPSTVEYMANIQKTAIKILQERNLTIDQRLMMLGLYLDKLNESACNGVMTSYEFEQLNEVYNDTNFLQKQSAQFSAVIKFNSSNFIKIMQELLNLQDGGKNEIPLELEKFVGKFSTIFENYLVNEFFYNLYPFRFYGNINLSYSVFIVAYKMLEVTAFSMADEFTEKDLIYQIMQHSNKIDHSIYMNKITEYMEDKSDILATMQNMLQV